MTRPSPKGRRDGPAECLTPDGNETRDQTTSKAADLENKSALHLLPSWFRRGLGGGRQVEEADTLSP